MHSHQYTIGKYLYSRLEQLGLGHIFGVPGDYIFDLLHLAPESGIKYIGTCNELNAGYAADAYARFKGIGAVLVTYAVGGLSTVNAIAGAFAEKIPVIIISGGPELSAYDKQPQKHHTLGDYSIPLEIFKNITVASACLLNPKQAPAIIDELLSKCMQYKQPVYIEIPCDIVHYPCELPDGRLFPHFPQSNLSVVKNAVESTLALLQDSTQPVIIVGNEVQRYGLQSEVETLIENSGFPFSIFITDKTTLSEEHPQFIGSCGPGIRMNDKVKHYIEQSDCLLCLGSIMGSHLSTCMDNLNIDKQILAFDHKVQIQGSTHAVNLHSFITTLNKHFENPTKNPAQPNWNVKKPTELFDSKPTNKITNEKAFDRIGALLKDDDILIVDTGSSLLTARGIFMPQKTIFLSQSYYASIGYSLAAALGAAIANPTRKIYVVIGDGSFQFTCQELSTLIKQGLTPTIFLINNFGYTIERALHKDATYNDIQAWKYYKLPEIFGGTEGYEVNTGEDLEKAIIWSEKNQSLSLIEIYLDKLDYPADLATMLEP